MIIAVSFIAQNELTILELGKTAMLSQVNVSVGYIIHLKDICDLHKPKCYGSSKGHEDSN